MALSIYSPVLIPQWPDFSNACGIPLSTNYIQKTVADIKASNGNCAINNAGIMGQTQSLPIPQASSSQQPLQQPGNDGNEVAVSLQRSPQGHHQRHFSAQQPLQHYDSTTDRTTTVPLGLHQEQRQPDLPAQHPLQVHVPGQPQTQPQSPPHPQQLLTPPNDTGEATTLTAQEISFVLSAVSLVEWALTETARRQARLLYLSRRRILVRDRPITQTRERVTVFYPGELADVYQAGWEGLCLMRQELWNVLDGRAETTLELLLLLEVLRARRDGVEGRTLEDEEDERVENMLEGLRDVTGLSLR